MIPMWAPFLGLLIVCGFWPVPSWLRRPKLVRVVTRCSCLKGRMAPGCPRHDPQERKA